MAITHRAYHLHVSKHASKRGILRWSVTRSTWGVGGTGTSGYLGAGEVEITVEGGTAGEQSLAVFRAALAAYEAQLRGPEQRQP